MNPRDLAIGLSLVAHASHRDLQRAARNAGGAKALWERGPAGIARTLGLHDERRHEVMQAATKAAVQRAHEQLQHRAVEVWEPSAFPDLLSQIYDPPFGLFAAGQAAEVHQELITKPVVAVVGSRTATNAGRAFAADLAAELTRRGALVVSGLARGIDAAAHSGALDAGGRTLAIVGCGVHHVYPRINRALRARILEQGAVATEYWLETAPAPWRFPARNRLVAGLAHATVVVEARARSGALITADFAAECGRATLAVPGAPWVDASQGCNDLVRNGAAVCTGADDVIAEVHHPGWVHETAPQLPVDGHEAAVLAVVSAQPCAIDHIGAATQLSVAHVSAALAGLEMMGAVVRNSDQTYTARKAS